MKYIFILLGLLWAVFPLALSSEAKARSVKTLTAQGDAPRITVRVING